MSFLPNARASYGLEGKLIFDLEVEFIPQATIRALRFNLSAENSTLENLLVDFQKRATGLELPEALKLPWEGDTYIPIPHWALGPMAWQDWLGDIPCWEDRGENLLCRCFGVSIEDIKVLVKSLHTPTLGDVANRLQASAGCTSCKEDLRRLLLALRKPENPDNGPVGSSHRHKIGDRTPLEATWEAHQITLQFFKRRPKLQGSVEFTHLRGRQLFFRWKGQTMPASEMYLWMADLERELSDHFRDEVLLTVCP